MVDFTPLRAQLPKNPFVSFNSVNYLKKKEKNFLKKNICSASCVDFRKKREKKNGGIKKKLPRTNVFLMITCSYKSGLFFLSSLKTGSVFVGAGSEGSDGFWPQRERIQLWLYLCIIKTGSEVGIWIAIENLDNTGLLDVLNIRRWADCVFLVDIIHKFPNKTSFLVSSPSVSDLIWFIAVRTGFLPFACFFFFPTPLVILRNQNEICVWIYFCFGSVSNEIENRIRIYL